MTSRATGRAAKRIWSFGGGKAAGRRDYVITYESVLVSTYNGSCYIIIDQYLIHINTCTGDEKYIDNVFLSSCCGNVRHCWCSSCI